MSFSSMSTTCSNSLEISASSIKKNIVADVVPTGILKYTGGYISNFFLPQNFIIQQPSLQLQLIIIQVVNLLEQ